MSTSLGTVVEKEIKIVGVNVIEMIEKLVGFGATKKFSGEIVDQYFDDKDNGLKKQKQRLRLRTIYTTGNKEKTIITMKKRLVEYTKSKTCEELEFGFNDKETAQAGLISIGYHPTRSKQKKRISYSLGEITFDIDFYEGLPPILEIEAPTDVQIYARVKALGYKKRQVLTCGYQGLLKRFKQKKDMGQE